MPWREVCPMDERMRFIGALLAQEDSMTELCERFGISSKTGYQLRTRYMAEVAGGIVPRSRAPRMISWAFIGTKAEQIVGSLRELPSCGPHKYSNHLQTHA